MPRTDKVRSMFDSIASDYDRLNHIMSLGIDRTWRRRAIKELRGGHFLASQSPRTPIGAPGGQPSEGAFPQEAGRPTRTEFSSDGGGLPAGAETGQMQVLDVACGTGDFSIDIARRIPSALVTGVDLSRGMLDVMEKKVLAEGLSSRITIQQGDCTATSFDDGSFDAVTIAFGIRNFEHREQALREFLRVLKPGARLVILELSVPSNPVLRALYKPYFVHIMPWIGGLISSDRAAYRYLPASVLAFPGPGEWQQTMRDAGFISVGHRALSLGLCRMYTATKPLQDE